VVAALWLRRQGRWRDVHGPFVLRGRAGTIVNVVAAAWLVFETINIAWPRYTDLPWWQNWAFLLGMGAFGLLGLVYFLAQRPDRRFELGGATVPSVEPAAANGASPSAVKREPAQT
jgi:hypothetical protein